MRVIERQRVGMRQSYRKMLGVRTPFGLAMMALGVGVGGALASVAFLWLILRTGDLTQWLVRYLGTPAVVVAAALGGLAVGVIVYRFAREAKGHGVPEVMAAVALKGGQIRPRVVLVKGLASAITIGTGGSAGREGPIVQIGAAIGSAVGQWFQLPTEHIKTLVACGAAAGIAATFNAPVGGVFFALEVILGDWSTRNFGYITLSSVAGAALAHAMVGDHPALAELSYSLQTGWELLFYALLGVMMSLGAQVYMKVLYATEDLADDLKGVPEWVKPAIGGVLFGLLGLAVPATLGRGESIVHALLSGHVPAEAAGWAVLGPALILLLLGLAKILSTSLTVGSGGSGGIFFPGLYIGAALGGAFGYAAGLLFPGEIASPGAYALVGMAAFFAGMTHAPITGIVMLFEMTRDYRIILPLMLACVVATAISKVIRSESIYTLKLVRRGVHLHRGTDTATLKGLTAADVITERVMTVRETDTLGEVITTMQHSSNTGFPVVDGDGGLVGIITLSDINRIRPEGRLKRRVLEAMTRPVVAVPPWSTLDQVLATMIGHDIGRVPVLDPEADMHLVGLITRNDVMKAYHTALARQEA